MSRPATSRLKVNPILGVPPSMEWIGCERLQIDPSYQRSIGAESSQALIRRIAMFWDWRLCQPLFVVRRSDGSLWVVDGQHRLEGARLRNDIPQLPCVIVSMDDRAEEAAAFVALNKERRALGSVDVWRAQLAAGDPGAVAVHDLIVSAGLTVAPHQNYIAWKPGMLFCVPGIASALKNRGRMVTSAALGALSEAYEGHVLRFAGTMLGGLFRFYSIKGRFDDFDPDLFIERLSLNSQEQWMRKAAERVGKVGGTKVNALTECFVEAYDSARAA